MPGFSVPAAEHSTITAWGREHEADAYENMLTQFPSGLVAVVSDSYNIYEACEHLWGEMLKDKVLARDGVLVVRPDSGNPREVVLKVQDILGAKFGYTTNHKSYRVLNPKVRVIQGDGVNYWTIQDTLTAMNKAGWSADNITFGMGGALLQQLNRDTQKFAIKASAAKVDGIWRDVSKDPVGDHSKASKAGRFKVVKRDGVFQTLRWQFAHPEETDYLATVFENGEVRKRHTIAGIRERAKQ